MWEDDDGGLVEFWLSLVCNWLLKLQDAYDQDKERGLIDDDGWTKEASDDAIMVYKLLAQTGNVNFALPDWSLAMASSTQHN